MSVTSIDIVVGILTQKMDVPITMNIFPDTYVTKKRKNNYYDYET